MGKKEYGDPRHPNEADYVTLRQMVTNATPGDIGADEFNRLCDEATDCFRQGEAWTGPDGERYIALRHARELERYGDPLRCQIVGYRKLRGNAWFVAKGDEIITGPRRTKRACLYHIGAKRGKIQQAGWYKAKGHDIFTRENAETVLGRKLTKEER